MLIRWSWRALQVAVIAIGMRTACAKDVECNGSNVCKNDAKCIKGTVAGKQMNLCICPPGFTGWDCSIAIDYCNRHCRSYSKDVPCQMALCNHGTCVNQPDYPFYSCNCGAFYTGKNCEIDYNPCSQVHTNPCEHGDCTFVRGTNQVLCQCHTGWTINRNQQFIKLNWNGVEIFVSPPCSEEVRRGIAGTAPTLEPRAKIVWYIVFFFSLALLLWMLGSMLYNYLARS